MFLFEEVKKLELLAKLQYIYQKVRKTLQAYVPQIPKHPLKSYMLDGRYLFFCLILILKQV